MQERRKIFRGMFVGPLISFGLISLHSFIFPQVVPDHGVLLELRLIEWVLLLWVPCSAYLWAQPCTPQRWWLSYGTFSCLIVIPAFWDFIVTEYGSGRRQRMPSDLWLMKLGALFIYFSLTSLIAAEFKALQSKPDS